MKYAKQTSRQGDAMMQTKTANHNFTTPTTLRISSQETQKNACPQNSWFKAICAKACQNDWMRWKLGKQKQHPITSIYIFGNWPNNSNRQQEQLLPASAAVLDATCFWFLFSSLSHVPTFGGEACTPPQCLRSCWFDWWALPVRVEDVDRLASKETPRKVLSLTVSPIWCFYVFLLIIQNAYRIIIWTPLPPVEWTRSKHHRSGKPASPGFSLRGPYIWNHGPRWGASAEHWPAPPPRSYHHPQSHQTAGCPKTWPAWRDSKRGVIRKRCHPTTDTAWSPRPREGSKRFPRIQWHPWCRAVAISQLEYIKRSLSIQTLTVNFVVDLVLPDSQMNQSMLLVLPSIIKLILVILSFFKFIAYCICDLRATWVQPLGQLGTFSHLVSDKELLRYRGCFNHKATEFHQLWLDSKLHRQE